ncbi:MAG: sigma-70 family RNA polymerase sigma factor [Cyanobacteria bacterium KgW148]|nr:sigma-70 family RNA polymerase sigma factor [Cyanobacteria bacterium KgW148]
MQLPDLPEGHHPLIKPLLLKGDSELLSLFQRYPTTGRYFAAIFCRYGQVVYSLTSRTTRSMVQGDFLFLKVWEYIFNELRLISSQTDNINLQSWIIDATGVVLNRIKVPPVEDIHYSLSETSPVFWCYLDQALQQLPGDLRLVLLLAETFKWSTVRIAAYLQAEGETTTPEDVMNLLTEAYTNILNIIPEDIQAIYFNPDRMTAHGNS